MEKKKNNGLKKFIIIFCVIAIVLGIGFFAVRSCMDSFEHNVYYYETEEGYGIAKEDYAGGDAFKGKVKIPASHKGKPVTEISDFGGNRNDVEFVLPDTLLYIRSGAFAYSNLTKITIPKSVKLIEKPYSTFNGCDKLTSFVVEDGNEVYDSRNDCNGLIETGTNKLLLGLSITKIPDGVTTIAKYAFNAQRTIVVDNLVLPNSVTTIEENAFQAFKMKSITLSENLDTLPVGCLTNCTELTSIYIPASVTKINTVFDGCTNLTTIQVSSDNTIYDSRDNCNAIIETATNKLIVGIGTTVIPSSVKIIGDASFYHRSTLTEIVIPEGVEEIGEEAFSGCYNLQELILPSTLTKIGDTAFWSCRGIETVFIPKSVSEIGRAIFNYCDSLQIYCEAEEKLPNWNANWNFDNETDKYYTVVWGVNYQEYLDVVK